MGRWAGVGRCKVDIDVIVRRIMDTSKAGNAAPMWVQPFRIVAGILAAMIILVLAINLVMTFSVSITARGAVMAAALLWFACLPRRFLARFWILASLLACAALAVVLIQPGGGILDRDGEMTMLFGDILFGGIFLAMLIDAVLSRRRAPGPG